MSDNHVEPFFIDTSAGRLFAVLRSRRGAERCVLFIPPFGEEMNKCRRQVTETAERLVEAGFAVLVVDLYGTGDSGGEFADARWRRWESDIIAAASWVERQNLALEAVVAIRLGCALAGSVRTVQSGLSKTVFWQPVANGRQFITQFLRLRVAASLMGGGLKETVDRLKARLADGEVLEIAGYPLCSELWRAVEAVELSSTLHPRLGKLAIFETGRIQDEALSTAGAHLLEAASQKGINAVASRIAGDPFWNSTEIVVNPELARRTVEFLAEPR